MATAAGVLLSTGKSDSKGMVFSRLEAGARRLITKYLRGFISTCSLTLLSFSPEETFYVLNVEIMATAAGVLLSTGKSNSKGMVFSRLEAGARLLITKYLRGFISTGSLTVREDGGTNFTFGGSSKDCPAKCVLRVHNAQFYWKVMTRVDIGLADAYIDGDFSLIDQEEGLLHLFLVLIANRDVNKRETKGWLTPLFFTAGFAATKLVIQHVLRSNSLTQARRNISRHYDLSNELFALFLDETMTYSTGIFEKEDEELKTAQLRKYSTLIEKARINKEHEVLDIGCGWGSFAIEVVKRTGCKYTGITLSEKQLEYAERKVKKTGLEEHIKFYLCDYRSLPKNVKYDRIVSCEMIEHVGHGYMEEFFRCCDTVLAKDGLFVLQFSSIPDERYEDYRKSSDFIKEYIFPGACVPSLSRIISAMAASTLCVEHLENIGSHYYYTLRRWRKIFLENRRTWEYYFDYYAAGFKTYTLGVYQIVFSRPGNTVALGDPYNGFPPAYPASLIP